MPPDPHITDNVADAGSAHDLVHGWRDCRSDDEYRAWLRIHLAAARDGGPELREAMASAEGVELSD